MKDQEKRINLLIKFVVSMFAMIIAYVIWLLKYRFIIDIQLLKYIDYALLIVVALSAYNIIFSLIGLLSHYYGLGDFRKSIKSLGKGWVIPIFVGVLVSAVIVPAIYERLNKSKLRKESYDKLVQCVEGDDSLDVKLAAVYCLGEIGDEQSLEILSRVATVDNELSGTISDIFEKKKLKLDTAGMLSELEKVYSDPSLNIKDLKFRLSNSIEKSIKNLRTIRDWVSNDKLTNSEKKTVENLKVIENLDEAIQDLGDFGKRISNGDENINFDFHKSVINLRSDIDKLNKETKRLNDSKNISAVTVAEIEKYNDLFSDYVHDLSTSDKDMIESEISKYRSIIKILARSGQSKAVEHFKKIALDISVAQSIRVRAIESLGEIGRDSELSALLKVSDSSVPPIRLAAIESIGKIISGKRDIYNGKLISPLD